MRLPFIQVESDFIVHGAASVAALLGCDVPQALGHVALLRAFAVSRAAGDAPPDGWVPGANAARLVASGAHWRGDPAVFIAALADPAVGLLEVQPDGIRVLGLEPYQDAWERNAKAKERMSRVRGTSRERSPNVPGQTQKQTQKKEERSPQPPVGGRTSQVVALPTVTPPTAPLPSASRPAGEGGLTVPDAVDLVHREVMEGRPYAWDVVQDERAATALLSLCMAEGLAMPDVPVEVGRRFGRALVRSLDRFAKGSTKAVTLRELSRRECWAANAEPPSREQEVADQLSGARRVQSVKLEPWDAVTERLLARGVP